MALNTEMKLITYISLVLLSSCAAIAKPLDSSGIPSSVNKIDTFRVNNNLVRVIKHNMELAPILEFELFHPPEMKQLDYLKIEGVTVSGRYYDFKKSEGVFIDSIELMGSTIDFKIDYYVPKGSEIIIECKLLVSEAKLSQATCELSK